MSCRSEYLEGPVTHVSVLLFPSDYLTMWFVSTIVNTLGFFFFFFVLKTSSKRLVVTKRPIIHTPFTTPPKFTLYLFASCQSLFSIRSVNIKKGIFNEIFVMAIFAVNVKRLIRFLNNTIMFIYPYINTSIYHFQTSYMSQLYYGTCSRNQLPKPHGHIELMEPWPITVFYPHRFRAAMDQGGPWWTLYRLYKY